MLKIGKYRILTQDDVDSMVAETDYAIGHTLSVDGDLLRLMQYLKVLAKDNGDIIGMDELEKQLRG